MICLSWVRQHARKLLTDSSPLTHSTLERAVSPEFGTARGHLGVASETPGRSGEKMAWTGKSWPQVPAYGEQKSDLFKQFAWCPQRYQQLTWRHLWYVWVLTVHLWHSYASNGGSEKNSRHVSFCSFWSWSWSWSWSSSSPLSPSTLAWTPHQPVTNAIFKSARSPFVDDGGDPALVYLSIFKHMCI